MKRVLIVDDSEFIRKTFLYVLRGKYRCDLAEDGEQGLTAFVRAIQEGDPYRFVLVDLSMPNMNGTRAIQSMRRAEAERGDAARDPAAILVLSAMADDPACEKPLCDCAVSAFLVKPVMPETIMAELARLG